MPAGAIKNKDGVCADGNGVGDLDEMGVHRLRVSVGHDQRGGGSAFGADGAKNVGRSVAGVAGRARAAAAWSPDAGQCALLADPGFVLKPHLQGFVPGVIRQSVGYGRGEVFLNVSCASGLDFGCCGRTERRRNPSAASCLPTVRSCMMTPKRASILR